MLGYKGIGAGVRGYYCLRGNNKTPSFMTGPLIQGELSKQHVIPECRSQCRN